MHRDVRGEGELHAQSSIRADAGASSIHYSSGLLFSVALGQPIGSSALRFELALAGSTAGYGTATGGVELRPGPGTNLTPLLAVRAGWLGESEFGGYVVEIAAGIIVPVKPNLNLRLAGSGGFPGGETGPIAFVAGLEHMF